MASNPLKELVETEKHYSAHLDVLVEYYVKQWPRGIEERDLLFCNVTFVDVLIVRAMCTFFKTNKLNEQNYNL